MNKGYNNNLFQANGSMVVSKQMVTFYVDSPTQFDSFANGSVSGVAVPATTPTFYVDSPTQFDSFANGSGGNNRAEEAKISLNQDLQNRTSTRTKTFHFLIRQKKLLFALTALGICLVYISIKVNVKVDINVNVKNNNNCLLSIKSDCSTNIYNY